MSQLIDQLCSNNFVLVVKRDHRGRDCMVVGLQLPVQSVPITTKALSLNPAHGEVYSIQHYAIKFVTDLRQVSGFFRVFRSPPPIKLTI